MLELPLPEPPISASACALLGRYIRVVSSVSEYKIAAMPLITYTPDLKATFAA